MIRLFLLIAAVACFMLVNAWRDTTVLSAPQTVVQRPQTGPRIQYTSGHYPVLTLPNGQTRVIHSVLNMTRPMRFGDYAWNDTGVPAGSTWIRIDLKRQTLSIFRAGHEIGSAVILYGTDGKPTPLGVFPVMEKAVTHRSSLYDAEMPYMMRLTGDGVAVHASAVRAGSATHGCIGVPIGFARLIFAQMKRGDVVAIQRGDADQRRGRTVA